MTAQMKLSNIIVENDSHIAINSIIGKIKAQSQITSLIKDITTLVEAITIIKFSYCNKIANKLEDILAKKVHNCTFQSVVFCY